MCNNNVRHIKEYQMFQNFVFNLTAFTKTQIPLFQIDIELLLWKFQA